MERRIPLSYTVFVVNPQVVIPPTSKGVAYGEQLTLECTVASFPAVNDIFWYKNGQRDITLLTNVVKMNYTATTSVYNLTIATETACGNYSCYNTSSSTAAVSGQ